MIPGKRTAGGRLEPCSPRDGRGPAGGRLRRAPPPARRLGHVVEAARRGPGRRRRRASASRTSTTHRACSSRTSGTWCNEFDYLSRKHGELSERLGVEFDRPGLHSWMAWGASRAGRRFRAAAGYLRAAAGYAVKGPRRWGLESLRDAADALLGRELMDERGGVPGRPVRQPGLARELPPVSPATEPACPAFRVAARSATETCERTRAMSSRSSTPHHPPGRRRSRRPPIAASATTAGAPSRGLGRAPRGEPQRGAGRARRRAGGRIWSASEIPACLRIEAV